MPRKRRSAHLSKDTRPAKKRRVDANPSDEKDPEDVEMSQQNLAVARERRVSFANVGGLISGLGGSKESFSPQFQPGAIRSLKLKNWVTFDEAYIQAVPGLNLIMGPNGTGKSSLICAICMVLNGKTQTLGRVDRIGDFVKRGETKASIEVVLEGGPNQPSIAIERHVKKSSGASTWKLNGKKSTASAITDVVSKLQIKVDNLCQFLAQDRVVEFARLSATDLLTQTLKAVASEDDDLVGQHQQLVEIQRDLNGREQEMKTVEANLAAASEEMRGLETVISNFRSREQMKHKLELVLSRVAWAKVEAKQQEIEEKKTELLGLQKEARAEEVKLRPLRNLSTSWRNKETNATKKTTALKKENASLMEKYKRLEKKHDSFNEKMSDEREEIKEIRKKALAQEKKKAKAERDLAKAEEEFNSMDPATVENARRHFARNREEVRQVRQEQTKMRQDERQLKTKQDEIESEIAHLIDRKQRLQDSNRLREEAIYRGTKRRFKEFAAWVASHRHEFDGEVIGPIISTVEVQSQLHAHYLNTAIPENIQYAWVTTTQSDWTKLSRQSKAMNLRALVLMTEPDSMRNYRDRPCSKETLRRRGAVGYLVDTFECPELVKCVLCGQTNLHKVAYADEQLSLDQRRALLSKSLTEQNVVTRLFEPSDSWSVTFSRYGDRDAITVSRRIRRIGNNDPGIRVAKDPTEEINRCDNQIRDLQNTRRTFEMKMKEILEALQPSTQRLNHLNQEKKQWQEAERAYKKAKNKVDRCQKKLQEVSDPIDIEREENSKRKTIKKLARQQNETLTKMVEILTQFMDKHVAWRQENMIRDHAVVEKDFVEQRIESSSQRMKRMKKRIKDAKAQMTQLQRAIKEAENAAKREYPREKFEGWWNEEEHLSKTLEELENVADDLQSRIACVLCNEADVARYKKLEREIAAFTKQLKDSTELGKHLSLRMGELEETWRPKIREIVEKVSRRFTELFAVFHANGEVHLREEELYDNWAIEIMTDFRPHTGEGLQPLSGYRQSGGERSVSTMLYLLSLQEVSTAPFRVVDEINQGMDPANERLIMDILNKECVPRQNREIPQYFVVTPKLLPRLQYSPYSAAFMIFNGPWVSPQSSWNVKQFLVEQTQSQG